MLHVQRSVLCAPRLMQAQSLDLSNGLKTTVPRDFECGVHDMFQNISTSTLPVDLGMIVRSVAELVNVNCVVGCNVSARRDAIQIA